MGSTAEHTALLNAVLAKYARDPTVELWLNSRVTMVRGERRARPALGTGTPDIVGNVAGRFAFFEGKTGDAVPDTIQRYWLEHTRDRGGFACVFRSVEEFDAAIVRCKAGGSE